MKNNIKKIDFAFSAIDFLRGISSLVKLFFEFELVYTIIVGLVRLSLPKQEILHCIATIIMIVVFYLMSLIFAAYASFKYRRFNREQQVEYWSAKGSLLAEYQQYVANNKPELLSEFKEIEDEFMQMVKENDIFAYYFNQRKFKLK